MIYHILIRNLIYRICFLVAKQLNLVKLLVPLSAISFPTSGTGKDAAAIGAKLLTSPLRSKLCKYTITALIGLCALTQLTYAQNDTIAFDYPKGGADRFQITAKLDFTGLLNPFKNSTGIVSDFRLNQHWSLEATLGSYFHSSQSSPLSGETYPGLKTAIGFKKWTNPKKLPSMYLGVFLGGNYIVNKKYRDVLRQNQFTQLTLVKRKILSASFDARFGFQWHMGEHKRFIIDYFIGLGLLTYRVQVVSPIEGEVLNDFREFLDLELQEGSGLLPHGYLIGLNVGYVVR